MNEIANVRVWFATTAKRPEWCAVGGPLWHHLDSDERARHDTFLREADRKQFLLAHGLKRIALAQTLGCTTRDLQFSAEDNGKPFLTRPAEGRVAFSISHGQGVAAVAVTSASEIGVDVEALDRRLRRKAVATVLSDPDRLISADADLETRLRLWTAREAFMKAVGLGLSLPRNAVSFRKSPSGFEVAEVAPEYGSKEQWHLLQRTVSARFMLSAIVRHRTSPIWTVSEMRDLIPEP